MRVSTESLRARAVDADIELLSAALDAATGELSGAATLAQVRALREAAVELRQPGAPKDARQRFAERIAALDDESLERQRALALERHLSDVQMLGRGLGSARDLVAVDDGARAVEAVLPDRRAEE